MRRKQSIRIFGTRGQRQAEACLRTHERRAQTVQTTTMDRLRGMSRLQRLLFALGLALLAIALIMGIVLRNTAPSSHPGDTLFMAKSHAAMNRMMAGMKIELSQNVDQDFVAMMVPHHQGAIDMAKAELRYGYNEPLRRLAQGIIVSQQGDIALMKRDLGGITFSSDPLDVAFLEQSEAAMTRMMTAMQIKPSQNVDQDFVTMMVPHHQGAIDMAKAELSYGHNEPLRGLAQEIIATQQQEIGAMQRALRG